MALYNLTIYHVVRVKLKWQNSDRVMVKDVVVISVFQ